MTVNRRARLLSAAPSASASPSYTFDDGAPENTPPVTVGREAGIGGRALMQGAADIEDAPMNIAHTIDSGAVWALKKVGAVPDSYQLPSNDQALQALGQHSATEGAQSLADQAGLATPATQGERVYSRAVEAIPSGLIMPGAGPVAGALSAAAGGAAAQETANLGGGVVAQTVAGLAAGGATGLTTGAVRGAVGGADTAAAGSSIESSRALLQQEGIPLNMAQATGSKLAQHIDRASQLVSRGATNFADQQGQAFNSAVLRRIGVDGETAANPEVMNAVKTRITGVMDDVAARSNTQLDPQLSQDITNITDTLPGRVPVSEQAPL